MKKHIEGRVVSDRMQKTIRVRVERRVVHPIYKKIVTRFNDFLAHDEKGDAKVGDRVDLEESRPLSKRKRWRLFKILEKAR